MRWEYQTLETDAPAASQDQLNEFGSQGWELAVVYQFGQKWIYIFKRLVGSVQ